MFARRKNQVALALVVVAVGLGLFKLLWEPRQAPAPQPETARVRIADKAVVTAEIANDEAERARGLSGRDTLADDTGMLFVYQTAAQPGFWMKDMQIPIDILWIAADAVVQIDANVPPPTATGGNIVEINPARPVDAVLEVPAGYAGRQNLEVGDSVEIN
jgi:uncharacterized membrane protein (UPF0127 family)